MPGSNPLPVDLRSYRPAAVLVIDMVSHSTRDQQSTMAIQGALNDALQATISSLHLSKVHVNHTGDGYVCTLFGDDSARILDFINALFPPLIARLTPYGQEIRGGVAFGVVHLRSSPLTRNETHFDLPGIEATRLEEAAQPGTILTTATVHSVFARHYPNMFGAEAVQVETKDRTISAYELTPYQEWNTLIRQYLTDFIFRQVEDGRAERPGILLLVDDVSTVSQVMAAMLEKFHPDREIVRATSASDALAVFVERPCAVVVTDIVMPGLSGVEMLEIMRKQSPDQIVIGISGYATGAIRSDFFRTGGFIFVAKPFAEDELVRVVAYALKQPPGDVARQQLATMCDDVVALWSALHDVATRMDSILRSVGQGNDVAQDMLRHKAKHLVNDGIARLGTGVEPVDQLRNLRIQLGCVERLARIVGRLGVQKISVFVGTLIDDLRRVHPRVEFGLDDCVGNAKSEVRYGGVVILAIAELIDNAVAAVGERGRVDVEVATLSAAGVLQIIVKDSGPGVREDLQSQMFEEEVSTKGAGRGLGLHLVRESVRSLRGSVTYSCEGGCTFCVRIPLTV